jgi:hypothetical protein
MVLKSLVVVVMLAAAPALADTLATDADVRKLADSAMSRVGRGDIAGAFAALKPYTIVPATEFDAMTLASKSQRDQYGARFGKAVGFEFVEQKRVGSSLLRLTYMEKTEKHVLPWYLYFYKGPSGWVLNSFTWNDRMQDLF